MKTRRTASPPPAPDQLSDPIMVRIMTKDHEFFKGLSREHDMPVSTIVRFAARLGRSQIKTALDQFSDAALKRGTK